MDPGFIPPSTLLQTTAIAVQSDGRSPLIVMPPSSQTVTAGVEVIFRVAAEGFLPLHYQWQFKGENLAGATNWTLRLNAAQTIDAGEYRVVVSNAVASSTAMARLTVIGDAAPQITLQPADQTVYTLISQGDDKVIIGGRFGQINGVTL